MTKKGNPRIEDGFLELPNELIEAFAKTYITGEEMRCLWVVLRQTFGWHKERNHIPLSKFQEMTGLKKPNIVRALKNLSSKNIIIKSDKGKQATYELNTLYLTWKPNKSLSKMITPPLSNLTPPNTKETANKEASKEFANGSEEVSNLTPPKVEELNKNEASKEFQNTSKSLSKMITQDEKNTEFNSLSQNQNPFSGSENVIKDDNTSLSKMITPRTKDINSDAFLQEPKYILLNINRDISNDISRKPSLIEKEEKEFKKEGAPTKEGAPAKEPPASRKKMLELIKAFCDEMGFQYGEASIKLNVKPAKWLVENYEIEQVIEAVKWQKSRLLKEKKDPATFIPNLATVEKWLDNWLGLMNKEKEESEKRKAGGYFI
jgi:phage replication O-like protein O